MVYRLDTPGVENLAITNAKIASGAVSTAKTDTSINNALVPINGIIMYSGTEESIPANWALCDGNNGTPNLVNKFIIAASSYDDTVTPTSNDSGWRTAVEGSDTAGGGEATKLLGTANLPSHTHTAGTLQVGGGDHDHDIATTGGGGSDAAEHPQRDETDGNPLQNKATSSDGHTHTLSGNTGDQGGTMGEAFDILPPYYAIAYIMRVS